MSRGPVGSSGALTEAKQALRLLAILARSSNIAVSISSSFGSGSACLEHQGIEIKGKC
jgi:hypothetical protein